MLPLSPFPYDQTNTQDDRVARDAPATRRAVERVYGWQSCQACEGVSPWCDEANKELGFWD